MVSYIQTRQLAVVKVNVWSWSALVTMTTSNHTLPALTNLGGPQLISEIW